MSLEHGISSGFDWMRWHPDLESSCKNILNKEGFGFDQCRALVNTIMNFRVP
jgi:hypothetical protein